MLSMFLVPTFGESRWMQLLNGWISHVRMPTSSYFPQAGSTECYRLVAPKPCSINVTTARRPPRYGTWHHNGRTALTCHPSLSSSLICMTDHRHCQSCTLTLASTVVPTWQLLGIVRLAALCTQVMWWSCFMLSMFFVPTFGDELRWMQLVNGWISHARTPTSSADQYRHVLRNGTDHATCQSACGAAPSCFAYGMRSNTCYLYGNGELAAEGDGWSGVKYGGNTHVDGMQGYFYDGEQQMWSKSVHINSTSVGCFLVWPSQYHNHPWCWCGS